jgi:hypothetical protein
MRAMSDDPVELNCTACGRPLGLFPEDQPDWVTGPLCGECYQSNMADEEILHDELYGEEG